MSCKLCSFPTVSFLSDSAHPSILPSFRHEIPFLLSPKPTSFHLSWSRNVLNPARRKSLRILSVANGNGETGKWSTWLPRGPVAERVFRLIAGAMASPIAQFLSSPVTFLHTVDSRVKLAWLLALVVLPSRSHIFMRFGLVVFLALMSVWILPKDVWTDQLGRVALLSGILFLMLGLGSDGAPPLVQLRTPPPSMMGLPELPMGSYSYSILKLGPLQLTRKGLSVASTSACLSFTIFQSASLCLTTTTSEQLAYALHWFMFPLKIVGVPVAEIILTLLLSLRFISIVFDEVRNAAMAIVSRRINWEQLTVMETLDIFVMYVRRIFSNIFKHAEQISQQI
ncbi:protein ABCI12, chloroplastic isoform X2 [Aristolochia californica]|uniref:protein ABCI12, chloroplastic isoform X2 n=1 Tax=Aristolochia californica TaxID=171875 RepID=UPI0035E27726